MYPLSEFIFIADKNKLKANTRLEIKKNINHFILEKAF
jgi:hypothetical protein